MKPDQISSYSQQSGSQNFGGNFGPLGSKKTDLPKDVLEALENEDIEEALRLLRSHEAKAAARVATSGRFFQIMSEFYDMILAMIGQKKTLKDKEQKIDLRKMTPEERSKAVQKKVKTETLFSGLFSSLTKSLFAPLRHLFQARPKKNIPHQPREGIKQRETALPPRFAFVQKPLVKMKDVALLLLDKIREKLKLSRKERPDVKLAEKRERPDNQRLSKDLRATLEQKEASQFKETVVPPLMKAGEITILALQSTFVPIKAVSKTSARLMKKMVKKLFLLSDKFERSTKRLFRKVKKALQPVKKFLGAVESALINLLSLFGIFLLKLLVRSYYKLKKRLSRLKQKLTVIWYGEPT